MQELFYTFDYWRLNNTLLMVADRVLFLLHLDVIVLLSYP
jgi:hypothetical protein